MAMATVRSRHVPAPVLRPQTHRVKRSAARAELHWNPMDARPDKLSRHGPVDDTGSGVTSAPEMYSRMLQASKGARMQFSATRHTHATGGSSNCASFLPPAETPAPSPNNYRPPPRPPVQYQQRRRVQPKRRAPAQLHQPEVYQLEPNSSGISPALKALTFSPALRPLEPPSLTLPGLEDLDSGAAQHEADDAPMSMNLPMAQPVGSSPLDSPRTPPFRSEIRMTLREEDESPHTAPGSTIFSIAKSLHIQNDGSNCSTPRSSPVRERVGIRWSFRSSCDGDSERGEGPMGMLSPRGSISAADMGENSILSPNSIAWVGSVAGDQPAISPVLASVLKPEPQNMSTDEATHSVSESADLELFAL